MVREITNYLCLLCDTGYDTIKEAEICEKECKELGTTIKDKNTMDLKNELPKITEIQKEIIEYWNTRGYENITHTLGMNIRLHLKDKYVHNGLDIIYLEQFYNLAQKNVFKVMDEIIKEEKERCGEANALTCYVILKERIEKE